MARVLQFRNSETTYPLSDDWKFDLAALERRLSFSPRYSKNGSNASGDRKSPSRNMPFRRTYTGQTDQEYINFMNELDVFFDEINGPFFLEDSTNSRRCSIEVSRISSIPVTEGERYRRENIELSVVMLDAEWQDLDEIVENPGEVINDGTFDITNPNKEAYPIIEITANTQIQEFSLINETNSTGFTMSILDFAVNDVIIVNSQTGTFTKSGVDITGNITEGGPSKLSTGVNQFKYNSSDGSCDIVVKWRKPYGY